MAETPYLIPIAETISLAWEKVKGTKGSIWMAIIIFLLIFILLEIINQGLISTFPSIKGLPEFFIDLVIVLLQAGIFYIGIKRGLDLPYSFKLVFHPFKLNLILKLLGSYFIQVTILLLILFLMLIPIEIAKSYPESILLGVIIVLAFIIGICAMIYVATRMYLAIAFVLDRGAWPWQSIRLSFKATRSNFWRIYALYLITWLIVTLSVIPLGIGLIWSLPWSYIIYGVMYKKLLVNINNQQTDT